MFMHDRWRDHITLHHLCEGRKAKHHGTVRRVQVLQALEHKVSRERVGRELEGCLLGEHPLLAVQLIRDMHVFPAVFQVPTDVQDKLGKQYGSSCTHALELADPLLQADRAQVRICSGPFYRGNTRCMTTTRLLPLVSQVACCTV